MSVTLTEAAEQRVRTYLAQRGAGIGLRFGVRGSGCSGYAYVVDYADAVEENDAVFGEDVKVVVDKGVLPLVDGTVIDFVRDGLNEVFVYRNPNVQGECGCGESFSI